jgi:hypothetical protein
MFVVGGLMVLSGGLMVWLDRRGQIDESADAPHVDADGDSAVAARGSVR